MNKNNYAVYILSNRRPDRVITYDNLRKFGYTGKIYIVCDDLDPTLDDYRERYGDQIVVFNKQKYIELTDSGDNFPGKAAVVYARNANFDIAEQHGYDYFIQLDDDYQDFRYLLDHNLDLVKKYKKIKNLDLVFDAMVEYFHNTNLKSLAMAQCGEMMGGATWNNTGPKRKVMNSFVLSPHRKFQFMGKINEDVNVYTHLGAQGDLFLTTRQIALQQTITQKNEGGLTTIYLELGTYVKSFYSVMYQPSSVHVNMMGVTNKRLHHHVNWKCTVPKILNAKYKR